MTSVAAVLGFSKDQRAHLGRWTIGVSSEECVRTSRQVVTLIQKTVNEAIVLGHPGVCREDEVIEALCAEASSAGGANPLRIRKRHSVINEVTGKYCLGGFYPIGCL